MGVNNLKRISGRINRGHAYIFQDLVDEFNDVLWSETSVRIYGTSERATFETGVLGYNYQRQREFVERLNGIADITESDYGTLENKTIKI